MILINREVELDLEWSRRCVLIEEDDHITSLSFIITSTKLCVPVVTLSINDKIKYLKFIKQGFKRRISWNKFKSEIATIKKQ